MDNCSENSSFYIYTMNSDNWNTRFYQYLKDNLDKVGSSEREIGRLIRPSAICERNSKSMHNFYEAPNALTTSQSWWPCIFQQFIFFSLRLYSYIKPCMHPSIYTLCYITLEDITYDEQLLKDVINVPPQYAPRCRCRKSNIPLHLEKKNVME